MTQAEDARRLASRAHADQSYGRDQPYTVHLDAVAALVGPDDVTRAVAYLHDIVEDTPVTLEEVRRRFGTFVAECVALVTDEPGRNRKERKVGTHAKLAAVEPRHYVALTVKVADRLANVEACVRRGDRKRLTMYRREQPAFREAAYRPGLCEELWTRLETLVSR